MTTSNPAPTRRGSLVGPVIVLLVGVIFLMSNLRPELSAWRLFARYWPFLLILWGAGRLVEYLAARMTSRPIGRTLTGGEVFFIILICLVGSGFSAAERGDWRFGPLRHRSLEVLGENFDFQVMGSRQVPPSVAVVVDNMQGNVRVVGVDTEQLRVTGQKSIKAFDRSSATEADKATPLEITEEAGRIRVRTNQDRLSGDRRISTDLVVEVPNGASLSLEGRSGDLEVKDLAGPVDINSNNAGVRLGNISKNVRVNVRRSDIVQARQLKGSLDITGRGRDIDLQDVAGAVTIDGGFSGNIKLQNVAKPVRYTSTQTELRFEKLPGRMEMDLGRLEASDVVGPFKLKATNKDVHIEDFTKEIEISTRRGDIDLRTSKAPLGNVQAESFSGNIKLELPGNARFNIEASTANGKAENDFSESIRTERRGNSAEIRGGGPGGAQVRLSTKRGNIALGKFSQTQSL